MPEFIEGDLFAQVAAVKTGANRVIEIIRKYGKEAYNTALQKYFDYGEQLTLAGLNNVKKGTFTATELLESGLTFKVTLTITDTKMVVDLRENPIQNKGPFNASREVTCVVAELALKALTSP